MREFFVASTALGMEGSDMRGRLKFGILDRYIGGQILFASVFGVVVLCFVLVLGNIFKEMLPRLVENQVSAAYFLKFILYVMPFSLVFTIPWGFLTAVLLVFGRISADNELVSMRMAGISTTRLCFPVLVIGAVFSGLCLWINVSIAPKTKNEIEQMFVDMATRNAKAIFVPDQMITAFPGNIIYFQEGDDSKMSQLSLYQLNGSREVTRFVHAKNGAFTMDEIVVEGQERGEFKSFLHMENSYMASREDNTDEFGIDTWGLTWIRDTTLPAVDLSALDNRRLKSGMLTNMQLHDYLDGDLKPEDEDGNPRELSRNERNKFRAEISKRWSFSLACVTFGLIGIPLGITAQRRETSIGFVLSLGVACAYFFFIIIGDTFASKGSVLPHVLMWLPNVLFLGIGIHLFRRLSKR